MSKTKDKLPLTQCQHIFEDGSQCKRKITGDYCWLHDPMRQRHPCLKKNLDGTPCSRDAEPGEKYCPQHKKSEEDKIVEKFLVEHLRKEDGSINDDVLRLRFERIPPHIQESYMRMIAGSPEQLKPIASELVIARAALENFQVVTRDMKCTNKKCHGTFVCNACGEPMQIDNSSDLIYLAAEVSKIAERFSKIHDAQKIYVEFMAKVVHVFMGKIIEVMANNVSVPADFRRISEGIDKLTGEFAEIAHGEIYKSDKVSGLLH